MRDDTILRAVRVRLAGVVNLERGGDGYRMKGSDDSLPTTLRGDERRPGYGASWLAESIRELIQRL